MSSVAATPEMVPSAGRPMFGNYIDVQGGNPKWVRAMIVAAILSVITTICLISFMWVAGKMSIKRVDPPTQVQGLVR